MRFDRNKFIAKATPIIETPALGVLHSQTEALNLLLDFIEGDSRFDGMNREVAFDIIAYFLATVAHETTVKVKIGNRNFMVKSFRPVEEMGGTAYLNRMYDTRTDLGNTRAHDGDGARYAGDGYVQNTGKTNAERTGRRLAGTTIGYSDIPAGEHDVLAAFVRQGGSRTNPIEVDEGLFVREHELLRVPKISYLDAIDGILTGRYTGKKASDYFRLGRKPDYYNARRIINAITAKNAHVARDIERMSKLFFEVLTDSQISNSIQNEEKKEDSALAPIQVAPPDSDENANPPQEVDGAVVVPATSSQTSDESAPTSLSTEAESPSAITTLIPHIDTAKSWVKRAFSLTGLGVAYAWYSNAPPEVRYGLIAIIALLIVGTTTLFIKYHERVFQLVTEAMKINADPNLPNVNLKAHKR